MQESVGQLVAARRERLLCAAFQQAVVERTGVPIERLTHPFERLPGAEAAALQKYELAQSELSVTLLAHEAEAALTCTSSTGIPPGPTSRPEWAPWCAPAGLRIRIPRRVSKDFVPSPPAAS